MNVVFNVIGSLIGFYMILIFIRVMLSWFSQGFRGSYPRFGGYQRETSYGKPYEILCALCDPYLNWFRRFKIFRLGALDFSPVAALAFLSVLNTLLATLARFGRISLGIILSVLLGVIWSALSFFIGFALLLLVLRFIAYMTRSTSFFWLTVERLSEPIIYRVNRIIFRSRIVHYLTSLITSAVLLAVLWIALRMLISFARVLLLRLPI
ncbi:MAG: YggT family protein [Spirochaetaceae bacterium]|nr:YggT family protein [Spirochaetaceae bacterium]